MNWLNKPTLLYYWPGETEYLLAIDENGTPDLKNVIRMIKEEKEVDINNRFFTITGVILNKESYISFMNNITTLKNIYWNNGEFVYKNEKRRVVLHSRDIRRRTYPFDFIDNVYKKFINDLTDIIDSTNMEIISSTIDKYSLVRKYKHPLGSYELSLTFVLERFAYFLNRKRKNGFIVLESRGKREDNDLLQTVKEVITKGTNFCDPETFARIKGVYFNPKWSALDDYRKSFVFLELADLVGYPMYRKYALGKAGKDYLLLKPKIYMYPDFMGKGIKIFPADGTVTERQVPGLCPGP